jgi:hypothetical protein
LPTKQDCYALTFDQDWAPDCTLLQVAEILLEYQLKATFFLTHPSPVVETLKDHPQLFELGIHPNFAEGSTQGESPPAVLKYCMGLVPGAVSVRSHAMLHSYDLLHLMCRDYGLLYDSTVYLEGWPDIKPFLLPFSSGQNILRLPYFWEDDLIILNKQPGLDPASPKLHVRGLKIFVFHPILITLNSAKLDNYIKCKKALDLPRSNLNELKPYLHSGKGVGTFFGKLCQRLALTPEKVLTISEIGYSGT